MKECGRCDFCDLRMSEPMEQERTWGWRACLLGWRRRRRRTGAEGKHPSSRGESRREADERRGNERRSVCGRASFQIVLALYLQSKCFRAGLSAPSDPRLREQEPPPPPGLCSFVRSFVRYTLRFANRRMQKTSGSALGFRD